MLFRSVILESMEFPEPVIELAIEPKTKAGQGKLGEALAKLAEEDPTFRAHTDQETGQTIIAGMGELHLDIIVDRLLREFKVEANVGAPQVAYKETITKPVDVDSKYAKQSGGCLLYTSFFHLWNPDAETGIWPSARGGLFYDPSAYRSGYGCVSVSYTHLDVYKRQVQKCIWRKFLKMMV